MKRTIFTIMLSLMLSIMAFFQKTVAVYVTSSDDVPQQTSKILGSELVADITKFGEEYYSCSFVGYKDLSGVANCQEIFWIEIIE